MTLAIRGVLEGFYGRPWTWDERLAVARRGAERGLTHFVYAPKDDPKHRERWREPYGRKDLDGFARLAAEGGLAVGFGISPGLSIDARRADDRNALCEKVDQVLAVGVELVMLAFDDLPIRPGLAEDHVIVTAAVREHLGDRARLLLVPTEYTGVVATPYLATVAEGVDPEVAIAWTGPAVVNDRITVEDARRRAEALAGRLPLLWDNYPVNDGLMADRLFLGPLRGREPGLIEACSGYLANAMVQPGCSLLPLASVAAFATGQDPEATWAAEAEAARLTVFAEACDGAVPAALVRSLRDHLDGPLWAAAAAPLAQWLEAAASCVAPGLEGEADRWLEQVHREAQAGLRAIRLIQATRPVVELDAAGEGRVRPPDHETATLEAFGLAARWPTLRRAEHSVMGVRCGFRPVIGQARDGRWVMRREAVEEDANAIDALFRLAFEAVVAMPADPLPVTLTAEGRPVKVAEDGTFRASPRAVVEAECGGTRTRVTGPASAPLGG